MNIKILREEQEKLAKKIILKDNLESYDLVGGCEVINYEDFLITCITTIKRDTKEIVETVIKKTKSNMEYIPTYLNYRIAPAIIEAYNELDEKPDILIINANGILHPRKIGAASHIGLLLDTPTIGVAKRLLCGEVNENKVFLDEKHVGYELITREFAKPIYVSPGHKVSMKNTIAITKEFMIGHKMPEPVHLAHKLAVREKKKFKTMEK